MRSGFRLLNMQSRFASTLARNGSCTEFNGNSKRVLDELPRGAYTTARTFGKHSVFELEAHVARIAQSSELMSADLTKPAPEELTDVSLLKPLVCESMASAIKGYESMFPDERAEEFKLTVVATWDSIASALCSQPSEHGGHFDLYCHCQALSYKRPETVKVEVRSAGRQNALAKDTNWTLARKPLEELMAEDCDEILLADESGGISEGSQTNFFAIDGVTGEVVTCADGVLEGTVRGVLLDVCAADGIGVRFESPAVADAHTWAGCAISSTSRLFLPIDIVTLPEPDKTLHDSGGEEKCMLFAAEQSSQTNYSDRVAQLADRVRLEVSARSTELDMRE